MEWYGSDDGNVEAGASFLGFRGLAGTERCPGPAIGFTTWTSVREKLDKVSIIGQSLGLIVQVSFVKGNDIARRLFVLC